MRRKIVAAARWGIANEPRIHYAEVRPMPLGRRLPLSTDCSGFVTLCYFLAGAPDPNGLGYSGEGWTGTLLEHLAETAEPRPGDVAVWGAYPGRHCALALEAGADPLLASHGMERGPIAIRFSDECRIQPALVTWLTATPGRSAARDASCGTGAEAVRSGYDEGGVMSTDEHEQRKQLEEDMGEDLELDETADDVRGGLSKKWATEGASTDSMDKI